jgi:RodZ C-terminal domain
VTVRRPSIVRGEDNDAFESNRQIASTFVRLTAVSMAVAGMVIYFSKAGRRPFAAHEAVRSAVAQASRGRVPVEPSSVPDGAVSATDSWPDSAGRPASTATPVVPASPAIADDAPVVVSLLATRACRISITIDGRQQDNQQFQAGERRIVEVRHDLLLTSDDAGAIAMMLNGQEARPLGRQGESVTARLNPGNFKDYLQTR